MKQSIQQIPLSKLVASPENVRKTNRREGLKQLAASIKAHGLMQNLTVKRVGTRFAVIAGGRRFTALQMLLAQKELAKDASVPCKVIGEDESAVELSLAENVGQAQMHPADQYEAFAALHSTEGMSIDDIAVRFGVSVKLVKQRLSLGAVSPKLLKLYRQGEMNLDQLTAFTITGDHKKQERVWTELRFNDSRYAILKALSEGQVASDDRRAIFIGAKAYQQAGGTIIRDLFDEHGSGFFADVDLLNRMVREKLQAAAAPVLAEGWKWVEIAPEFDHSRTSEMRRARPEPMRLSDQQQAKLDELEAEYTELAEGEGELSGSEAMQSIEAQIEALTGSAQYRPDDIATAGAFLTLGRNGEPQIERGFIRAEDDRLSETEGGEDDTPAQPENGEGKPLSAALIAELTATRTLFLRHALSQKPDIALRAVTHALATAAFFPHADLSCLEINQRSTVLSSHAPSIDETEEAKDLRNRHEAWSRQIADEPTQLWNFVLRLTEKRCLELLAHCAALAVNAVRPPHARETAAWTHADALAEVVKLEIAKRWQPTAANYFSRVSKERVLEAVREGATEADAARISGMKKQDMAAAAERLLAGKGWLPAQLR
jgi:ParB family chromosome partitioning protein